MFLLAYTDLRRGDRTTLRGCTARSLRRVGADVAVVLHCSPANAKRLRRDARYDHVVTYTLEEGSSDAQARIEVAVLSDCALSLSTNSGPNRMLCDLTVDGKTASVGAIDRPTAGLYTVLLRIHDRNPVVLVGECTENLDDPAIADGIIRAGFIDTHPAKPRSAGEQTTRTRGILAKGLHAYGDGTYVNPDGCRVHWARLGH